MNTPTIVRVELSLAEIELIKKAITAYHGEPVTTGMMTSLMSAMFLPPSKNEFDEQVRKEEISRDIERSTKEVENRKTSTIQLQAKFQAVCANPKEFSVS